MNMQNLMAQAQKMQKEIAKKQEEINAQTFIGESEWITVTFNGKKEMLSIKIKETAEVDDRETLEDMITIAVKSALKQIDDEISAKMGGYGQSLNGLF